ncbi:TPA: hypothetical protein ACVT6Z_003090 [Clostridioides difficile]
MELLWAMTKAVELLRKKIMERGYVLLIMLQKQLKKRKINRALTTEKRQRL